MTRDYYIYIYCFQVQFLYCLNSLSTLISLKYRQMAKVHTDLYVLISGKYCAINSIPTFKTYGMSMKYASLHKYNLASGKGLFSFFVFRYMIHRVSYRLCASCVIIVITDLCFSLFVLTIGAGRNALWDHQQNKKTD